MEKREANITALERLFPKFISKLAKRNVKEATKISIYNEYMHKTRCRESFVRRESAEKKWKEKEKKNQYLPPRSLIYVLPKSAERRY